MNNRLSIKCATCEQNIVLRIGLGHQTLQKFALECPNCKLKIALQVELDKSKHSNNPNYKAIENCILHTSKSNEYIVFNLHSELIYPKEFLHEEIIMPAMFVARTLEEHARKKGFVDFYKPTKTLFGIPTFSIFDSIGGDQNLLDDWNIIKKSFLLYQNNKFKLSNKELSKYSNINKLKNDKIQSVIFDFLFRFISPNTLLYNDIKKQFNKAKNRRKEFNKFRIYYLTNFKKIHWKNYILIFDEYFKNFSEFNRLYINSKLELHPENGTEGILCPTSFNEVSMFYGNAFEYITSHIPIFACINNINNNRNFDIFKKLTLDEYLNLNKKSRFKTLEGNLIFSKFTDNLNSTIRNASHHKWFYINDENPRYLEYRTGGTGSIRQISYIDYIYESNILMIKLAIMALIEIKFLYK